MSSFHQRNHNSHEQSPTIEDFPIADFPLGKYTLRAGLAIEKLYL